MKGTPEEKKVERASYEKKRKARQEAKKAKQLEEKILDINELSLSYLSKLFRK